MEDRSSYVNKIQTAMQVNGRLPYGAEIVNDVLDAIELIEKDAAEGKKKEILQRAKERGEKGDTASVEVITCGENPGVIQDDDN